MNNCNTRGWLIGCYIAGERKRRGWTQAHLARLTGIHRPNVARLESGRCDPALETLARVARAMGVRLSSLVAAADDTVDT